MGDVQSRCWSEPTSPVGRSSKQRGGQKKSYSAHPCAWSEAHPSAWEEERICRQGGALALQGVTAAAKEAVQGRPCMLAEMLQCHQGLLLEIASYTASSPQDLFSFLAVSSFTPAVLQLQAQQLWSRLFQLRWPAFFDSLQWTGTQCWRRSYKRMLAGDCECLLEVYHREKKVGFTMSVMSARIRYDRPRDVYVTKYQSVNEVPPEYIPMAEEHRLRFCPASARGRLQPGRLPPARETSHGLNQVDETVNIMDYYPYKVLEGLDDLEVGSDVELQWKMQAGSPFGLWFGNLESLVCLPGAQDALATVTFNHFPPDSSWYRLQVRVGGPEIRRCDFGGYTGGMRRVTESEKQVWMLFFPGKPFCKLAIQEQILRAQALQRERARWSHVQAETDVTVATPASFFNLRNRRFTYRSWNA